VVYRDGVRLGEAKVTGPTWTYDDSSLQDGHQYVYTACVEDAAGNRGIVSADYVINIDITPPSQTLTLQAWDDKGSIQGEIKNGDTTDDDTPTLYGTISAPLNGTEEVHVFRNGVDIGKATVAASGTDWTIDDGGLSGGTYTYVAKVVDAAGNTSADSNSLTFILGYGPPPNFTTILRVDDNVDPVQGPVPDHGATNDPTPTLIGSTNAAVQTALGEYVEVLRDGVAVGHATMISATTWSYEDSGLIDGQTYVYTAQVVNAAGTYGGLVSNTWTITFDITPPMATTTIEQYLDSTGQQTGWFDSGTTTDETAPELHGTVIGALGAGEVIAVYRDSVRLGTATVAANGVDWTFQDSGLQDGKTYTYIARAEDAAGNYSDPSADFIINVDLITASAVTAAITGISNDTGADPHDFVTSDQSLVVSAQVQGDVPEGGKVQMSMDGGATWHDAADKGGGAYEYDARSTPLAEGEHDVQVQVLDANNAPVATGHQSVTIDLTPPEVAIDHLIVAGGGTLAIAGTAEADSMVRVTWADGSTSMVEAGKDGAWSVTSEPGQGTSPELVTAIATDRAGNIGGSSGDDLLAQTDGTSQIDGRGGFDTVLVQNPAAFSLANLHNIEQLDFGAPQGSGTPVDLTLKLSDVLSATDSSNKLIISGGSNVKLTLAEGEVENKGQTQFNDHTYEEYTLTGAAGTATLLIEEQIGVMVV
jgi:hypothetical protein